MSLIFSPEAGLGIPVKLLHEGIGHTVTCAMAVSAVLKLTQVS